MITPTVGRIVWFHEAFVPDQVEQPLAAMICKVHDDRCVNLVVFTERGDPMPQTSVTLRQEGDVAPSGNFCEWMPYQLAAATGAHGDRAKALHGGPQSTA